MTEKRFGHVEYSACVGVSQCESAVAAGLSACSVSPKECFFFFFGRPCQPYDIIMLIGHATAQ